MQHKLNILFDPSTPEQLSHNALPAPLRLKTLRGKTVDQSSEVPASRSHEDTKVEIKLI